MMRNPAPPEVVHVYTTLLEDAILDLRMRLRSGESISDDELHDFLDALHNIPAMLKNYGNWFVEENIDAALEYYDQRWIGRDESQLRRSLIDLLEQAKNRESDHP